MARFAALTGRRYGLFEYAGHPEAERVIVIMGSGADTVHETVDYLAARGDKVGVLKVHLFRPFSIAAFLRELPRSVRAIAVMDRTKEPGALGEPLYQDVVTALAEARADGTSSFAAEPVVVGGRYGLSSKEFTPAMVKAIFDTLAAGPPEESLHRRHHGRRDPHVARLRRHVRHGAGRRHDRVVLRPRRRRHRRRQQELDQDHRGRDRSARAGLLRLRLQEGGRDDGLPPAHEPSSDPVGLSDLEGPVRRVPSIRVPGTGRRARTRGGGGGLPAERALRGRRGLGAAAARGAGAADRQAHSLLHDRCVRGGARDGHGRPDQHDHADLLLRDLRRPAARGGDRADQARDRKDLQQARRGGREAQLRGGRRDARPLAGGAGAVGRHRDARPSAAGVRAGARLRPADHGRAPGREGRSAAGERVSGGRHVAGRHGEVGEAEPRARDPGVGRRASASSAINACWCVRMRPSGPRCTTTARSPARRRRSSPCPTRGSSSRRGRTRFRWRRRTARAATCA